MFVSLYSLVNTLVKEQILCADNRIPALNVVRRLQKIHREQREKLGGSKVAYVRDIKHIATVPAKKLKELELLEAKIDGLQKQLKFEKAKLIVTNWPTEVADVDFAPVPLKYPIPARLYESAGMLAKAKKIMDKEKELDSDDDDERTNSLSWEVKGKHIIYFEE